MNDTFITVEHNGEKLELQLSGDKAIDDWKFVFRSILSFITFYPNIIDRIFPDTKGYLNDEEKTEGFNR